MARVRILPVNLSYQSYDSQGRELADKKKTLSTGSSDFFHSPIATDLIGKEAGFLLRYHQEHADLLVQFNQQTQANINALLAQTTPVIHPDWNSILFPPCKKFSPLLMQQLYQAVTQAAEWVVKKPDDDVVREFLKTVGEYAESKIIELPWHVPVPTELYLISVLASAGATEFLNIKKEANYSTYVNQYIKKLNAARQATPPPVSPISNTTAEAEINKFAEKIKLVHDQFGPASLITKINEIEKKREQRAKTFFGRVVNFFSFGQKRELANLKKLRAATIVNSIFHQTSRQGNLWQGDILKHQERYKAWKEMHDLKKTVLEGKATINEIDKFYLCTLALVAPDSAETMKQTVFTIYRNIVINIRSLLNQANLSGDETEQLKTYLRLFQAEKINIPHNENLQFLQDAKKEINELLKKKIEAATSLKNLEGIVANIQTIWPDAIQSQYIEIENQSETDFFIPAGQRLDTLPQHIQVNADSKNYVLSVDELTLPAREKRVFLCNPISKDNELRHIINQKSNTLSLGAAISKLDDDFKSRVEFLKKGERGLVDALWHYVIGNYQTPLTVENQQKYGDELLTAYSNLLFEQSMHGTPEEKQLSDTTIVEDVEGVAKAFDANLTALLNKHERNKIATMFGAAHEADPDVGHLLLQWQFINLFRKKFPHVKDHQKLDDIYRQAGLGIIFKMDEIARNHPRFIHDFLGKMTKQQLDVLHTSFVSPSNVMEQERTVQEEGRTVLSQSLLLSSLAELIKQELLRFINGESLDIALFKQHIEFVNTHLPSLKRAALDFNEGEQAKHLKDLLKIEMGELLEKDNDTLENGIYPLAMHLTQFSAEEPMSSDFCSLYRGRFSPDDLKKRQASVKSIAEKIYKTKCGEGNLNSIFAGVDDVLIDIVDTYIKHKLKPEQGVTLASKRNYYLHLKANYDKLAKSGDKVDLIDFAKDLTDDVIKRFSSKLREQIYQVQYAFADRLTGPFSHILGENLESIDNVETRLNELKAHPAFSSLISQLFPEEKDKKNIFNIHKNVQPSENVKVSKVSLFRVPESEEDEREIASFIYLNSI